MFDDHTNNSAGSIPGNLPVGEPEDIFAGTEGGSAVGSAPPPPPTPVSPAMPQAESAPPPSPVAESSPAMPAEMPMPGAVGAPAPAPTPSFQPSAPSSPSPEAPRVSAMDAGVLKPKVSAEEGMPPVDSPVPPVPAMPEQPRMTPGSGMPVPGGPAMPAGQADMYAVKGPSMSRGVLVMIVVIVALVIVGAGGWWIYSSFIGPSNQDDIFVSTPNMADDTKTNGAVSDTDSVSSPVQPEDSEPEVDISADVVDDSLLFGEPLDLDEDQLDDDLEKTIGTDPKNWDTDGDELGDGEEVLVWDTDPLNPDTDGDSYLDGLEILSGYSPVGPGKLLNPPTTTPEDETL